MLHNTKDVSMNKHTEQKKSKMLMSLLEQQTNNYKSVQLKSQSQEQQKNNQLLN
jgi:hypothetical protein